MDSQEELKIKSSRQKETGKAKNDPEKNFEGDFKKMELTLGTAEREAKDKSSWRKGVDASSLIERCKERIIKPVFLNIFN